jgi:hypothetical protein
MPEHHFSYGFATTGGFSAPAAPQQPMHRRAMLLALGVNLADVELPIGVATESARVHVAGRRFDVLSASIESYCDMIETTTFGSTNREYIRGSKHTTVTLDLQAREGFNADQIMEHGLDFSEVLGDVRVTGLVRAKSVWCKGGGLVVVDGTFDAEPTIEPVAVAEPMPLAGGRRAMNLKGEPIDG